ncbi:DUF3443 domain-containing protein [Paraburkholderia sp. J12]|uniref:DUF3443 domain-containing protein n=1 Tax=Paraburkholderia sp. J12 TaxID=2805432 RepID=UPI002ABD3310|nr:DUF3443 domain-containing protein [Paraburkholderia sp. J12]
MNGRPGGATRFVAAMFCTMLLSTVGACGGGGGSGSNTAVTNASPGAASTVAPASSATSASAPVATSTPTTVSQSATPNVVAVTVGPTPTLTLNMLTTSVTVCAPGTSNCATIDNVQVDTGSQGLRLLASALPSSLVLPAVPAGSGSAAAGECAVFGTGYSWGAVRLADVKLAGETATSLPIQVIGDPSFPATPSSCESSGIAMNNATTLHANGILGVGLFNSDCGLGCASQAISPWYYACPSSGCAPSSQPLAQQVSNPVAAFSADNNGVVIDLPAIGADGASSVSGTLTFGIGTQADNQLGSATVLHANASNGFVTTTTSDGTVYPVSYLDSGANGLFFSSSAFTLCGDWFCSSATQNLNATITDIDNTNVSINMSVVSVQTLLASSNWAFNDLAGYNGSIFAWGLPFFYGRRVYAAIDNQTTPAGNGPFFAF